MKMTANRWGLVFLVVSVPFTLVMLNRRSAQRPAHVVRFATFNAALNRDAPGALLAELKGGRCEQAQKIAEIVQRSDVDVLLVCELDRDDAAASAQVLADEYFAVGQHGASAIQFGFVYAPPVNTGSPSGLDLDHDGETGGPGDAFGFGRFPGQYGMAVYSRYPILLDRVRTFQTLRWSAMPGALRPEGCSDTEWQALRLSSKNHVDVPIGVGPVDGGVVIHLLCSHPTPPVFDGPEDRNGKRNHDEVRFWAEYLTAGRDGWIVDDRGQRGGLGDGEQFVIMGDQNCDPYDGDGIKGTMQQLLAHPRVQDPEPRGAGGVPAGRQWYQANFKHESDSELDTYYDDGGKGPGNLRLDYVLPAKSLLVTGKAVFWPAPKQPFAELALASDHRLVWVEVRVD